MQKILPNNILLYIKNFTGIESLQQPCEADNVPILWIKRDSERLGNLPNVIVNEWQNWKLNVVALHSGRQLS